MAGARQYVFGYGSLLERAAARPLTCELSGYRRTWNVAMENRTTIPGYKCYVDPHTGARPDAFVVFLNIVPDAGARVNGVLVEITPKSLRELDRRERNYARIEVTSEVAGAATGRVWAYAGTEPARRRYETGRAARRAVVSREYYDRVLGDFARVSGEFVRRFHSLTDPLPCPVVSLRRVDL